MEVKQYKKSGIDEKNNERKRSMNEQNFQVFKQKLICEKRVKRVKMNYFKDKEPNEINNKIKRSNMSIVTKIIRRNCAIYFQNKGNCVKNSNTR